MFILYLCPPSLFQITTNNSKAGIWCKSQETLAPPYMCLINNDSGWSCHELMEAAISLVYEALGDKAKCLYICSGKYLMMVRNRHIRNSTDYCKKTAGKTQSCGALEFKTLTRKQHANRGTQSNKSSIYKNNANMLLAKGLRIN